MANPNLVGISTVLGKTETKALTTNAQILVSNAASSNKVFKINSIMIANIDGSNTQDVTVNYYSEDDIGGTATAIASTLNVPADSTVLVIDKNSALYLEEDRSIGALAGGNSDLVAIVSYEEIS